MRKLILESDEDFMKKLISNNLIDGRITVYQLKKLQIGILAKGKFKYIYEG